MPATGATDIGGRRRDAQPSPWTSPSGGHTPVPEVVGGRRQPDREREEGLLHEMEGQRRAPAEVRDARVRRLGGARGATARRWSGCDRGGRRVGTVGAPQPRGWPGVARRR